MKAAFEQLTEFLNEMFQFDANDLDKDLREGHR